MKRHCESSHSNGHLPTPERLLDRYNRGYSTASEVMLGVLTLTDKREIRRAIRILPSAVLDKLEHFVGYYDRNIRVFNGPAPDMETVNFVKNLFETSKARPV